MPELNPFTPTFGKVPPFAAGRDDILADMAYAFDNGSGDPNLSTVIVGPRGMGKTALLALIADEASAHGWISASVSAIPGMLDDILLRAAEAAREFVDEAPRMHLQEVGIPQLVNLRLEHSERGNSNWRSKMNRLFDELAEHEIGLLITVDEVTVDLDEMVQLASTYQHFITENRKVALVMAGLPYNVSSLLDDKRVSFLRRSKQRKLGRIPDADVENALVATIEAAGKAIDDDALTYAVAEIGGFPFMMQLVGYRTWASCKNGVITLADAERGARQARQELTEGVIEATCNKLSANDLRFCVAMLEDRKSSRLSDVAARMGVKSNYASTYKKRLLAAGVIDEHAGALRFAIPGLREHLEETYSE